MKKFLCLSIMLVSSILFSQPKTYSNYVQWIRPVSTISVTMEGQIQSVITSTVPVNGEVSVNNFPSVQIVSGTVNLNDSVLNRVVIRNASPERNLNVNTYNGLDVRLMNSVGLLISDTNPLAVNFSVFTSSYVETNLSGTIKSSSGYLRSVLVGVAGSESSIVINDGTKKIAEIDTTSSRQVFFDITFTTNLNITTSGTTPAKLTIIYK